MKIYIYVIYFPTSNKYYIGQTYSLEQRMYEHLRSGSVICKALYKYNDWKISILHTCKTRDEANRIEIEEIRNFNSVAPNGYNLTRGGEGGKPSEETKEKNRQAHLGTHHTKEAKNKVSKSLIGNKRSKGHGAPKGSNNGMKNPTNVLKMRFTTLKNKIKNLEKELNG